MRTTLEPGMILSNFPPVGGDGGGLFDSGCNPSGVVKVRIECGYIKHNGTKYMNTIKRIWLDFQDPSPESDSIFYGYPVHGTGLFDTPNKTFTFPLGKDDQIVRVVVWSDGVLANAVQFHTEAGIISAMYGMPGPDATSSEFQGHTLVGVYGRFGVVIDKLGFSFATTVL
jgi:Jacalin-like lectin domain